MIEEMQKKLQSKDADLTRVRGQREDLKAEATELKAKEGEKLKQLAEIRKLANSRQVGHSYGCKVRWEVLSLICLAPHRTGSSRMDLRSGG